MIYITGDTHRDFTRLNNIKFNKLKLKLKIVCKIKKIYIFIIGYKNKMQENN